MIRMKDFAEMKNKRKANEKIGENKGALFIKYLGNNKKCLVVFFLSLRDM